MTTQGQRIRDLASAHGMNVAELARAANIDESAMVNITQDRIGLGKTRGQRIADALDVDVSEVLLPKAEAVTLAYVARRLESLADTVAGILERQATLTKELADARTRLARLEPVPARSRGAAKRRAGTG